MLGAGPELPVPPPAPPTVDDLADLEGARQAMTVDGAPAQLASQQVQPPSSPDRGMRNSGDGRASASTAPERPAAVGRGHPLPRPELVLLQKVMRRFGIADLLLDTPATWCLVLVGRRGWAHSGRGMPEVGIILVPILSAYAQAIVLIRALSLIFTIGEISFARHVFQPIARHECVFVLYSAIIMHVGLVSGLVWSEGALVWWKVVIVVFLLLYNLAMWSCHTLWRHQLQATILVAPRVLNHSATKQFQELGENLAAKNTSCCICLQHFEPAESVMVLPCEHVLHDPCARRWIKDDHSCPYRCDPPEDDAPLSFWYSRLCGRPPRNRD